MRSPEKRPVKPESAVESGVSLPAHEGARLSAITYEWEDGQILRLTMEQVHLVRSYCRPPENFSKCLRFLGSLPNEPVSRAHAESVEPKK